MYQTLLSSFFFFCSLCCFGQSGFNDSHQLLWLKGIPTTDSIDGFNYNTRILISGEFPVLNKKFTSSQYSYVFYILQSTKQGEKLFSLYDNGQLHSFYTDAIKSTVDATIDVSYLSKGAIVNFNFFNTGFQRKKSKGIFYLENMYDKTDTALYEVIICNDCSDQFERDKIETYLALKYGITLVNKEKYWSSGGIKIWDPQYDTSFNNNIIGVVKDSFFGLEQLATSSNVESEVRLRKTINHQALADQTYLLIGDNGQEKAFDKDTNRFKRQWLAQNKGEYDVEVDLAVMVTPEKDIAYYLYTSSGMEVAHDKLDTLKLSFKNIALIKRTETYLSIGRVKPFAVEVETDTMHINHSYRLLTNEQGVPPFYVQATNIKTQEEHFFITEQHVFPIEDLPSATYHIRVQDSQDNLATIEAVDLDFGSSTQVVMASKWVLQGRDIITVKPQLSNTKQQFGYRWYLGDKIISTAPVLRVNYAGKFSLEMTDTRGKRQHFEFVVDRELKTNHAIDEQWLVSPNPVKAGEEFNVHYFFESDKYVDFYIYTLEGKFIQHSKHGRISEGNYTYRLSGKTTYLLISIINNKTSIQKLIVK